MVNWKSRVLLADIHEAFRKGNITVEDVGEQLAERLERNRYRADIDYLIEELRAVNDIDVYDCILEELYDFGDWDHRIWFENL